MSRLVTPTGTKGCASHVALAAPFVPAWRSRLGNQDNRGFPTGTNERFCSSVTDAFYYSSVPDVPCQQCGKSLDHSKCWLKCAGVVTNDGVFVRGGISYATTDNLQVVPADTDNLMNLLHDLGIEDVTMLEEKTLELGLDEVSTTCCMLHISTIFLRFCFALCFNRTCVLLSYLCGLELKVF